MEFSYFLPDAVQEQAKERLQRAVKESEIRRNNKLNAQSGAGGMMSGMYNQNSTSMNRGLPEQIQILSSTHPTLGVGMMTMEGVGDGGSGGGVGGMMEGGDDMMNPTQNMNREFESLISSTGPLGHQSSLPNLGPGGAGWGKNNTKPRVQINPAQPPDMSQQYLDTLVSIPNNLTHEFRVSSSNSSSIANDGFSNNFDSNINQSYNSNNNMNHVSTSFVSSSTSDIPHSTSPVHNNLDISKNMLLSSSNDIINITNLDSPSTQSLDFSSQSSSSSSSSSTSTAFNTNMTESTKTNDNNDDDEIDEEDDDDDGDSLQSVSVSSCDLITVYVIE